MPPATRAKAYKYPLDGKSEAVPLCEIYAAHQGGFARICARNESHISIKHFINIIGNWKNVEEMLEESEKEYKEDGKAPAEEDTAIELWSHMEQCMFM